jgi:hypothetical protein
MRTPKTIGGQSPGSPAPYRQPQEEGGGGGAEEEEEEEVDGE